MAFGIDPAHPLADLRLMPLLTGPLSDFQAVRDAATAQAAEAERLGEKRVDLHADLPPAFVGVVRTLTEAMEEADEVAASGALLTLPSEPDMAALRRWIAEEISRQVDLGAEPRPCPLPG